ncbi:hypothetical protein [Longimicrobium sp.]|uniref:hypothetical protein n=1 Tax=Longimicrobium sp. TaxID=2029185 RepID=UPI002E2F27DA|nr:hypothetical protein [Longimicrobium sp.]HEX6038267.1 hypothetical protein [Longimicrobium sp.]
MNATRLWVLTALPFALAACGGGDDAAEGGADTTAAVVTDTTTAPMATGTTPMGTDTTMTGAQAVGGAVTLNAVGTSGVTGTAQLMDHGSGQTMVTVNLMAQGNTTHGGHIHTGTCEQPGPPVAPLENVTLANGAGTSSSTVNVPLATVMNGQHIIAYHERAGDDPGSPVTCGAIPAQQGGATGAAM